MSRTNGHNGYHGNGHIVRAEPRRVHWFKHPEDLKCAVLASLGLSVKRIEQATKLTPSQISYRMALAGVRLKQYREQQPGTLGGKVAGKMMQLAGDYAKRTLSESLRQQLPTKTELARHGR